MADNSTTTNTPAQPAGSMIAVPGQTTMVPTASPAAIAIGDPEVEGLGEAGKKALDAERAERRKAEKRAKELDVELAKFREASMSEQEKAVEAARREAATATITAVNQRILKAEIRAAAGGKLADPEDAIRFLDLDEFTVSDEGDVDQKAVYGAIDRLLQLKPYLAAGATRPAGDADQGARGAAMALNGDPLLDSLKAKLGIR